MRARWARTARGWSTALFAGVLTAALHASAGGSFPSAPVLLLTVLLSGLLSTALVGRTLTLPRLAASVAAGQVTFHAVFTVFGNSPGVATATSTGPLSDAATTGHAAHGMLTMAGAAPAHSGGAHSGWGMLAVHLLAGLISALLLAHGERAISALGRIAHLALRILAAPTTPAPLPRAPRTRVEPAVDRSVSAEAAGVLRHRGPPALLRAT
jgi:hypothetical protein